MLESLLGPLGKKEYCLYFYYLSIISLIFLVIGIGGAIGTLFSHSSKERIVVLQGLIPSLLTLGIAYFQNRLLYSVCVGSLH